MTHGALQSGTWVPAPHICVGGFHPPRQGLRFQPGSPGLLPVHQGCNCSDIYWEGLLGGGVSGGALGTCPLSSIFLSEVRHGKGLQHQGTHCRRLFSRQRIPRTFIEPLVHGSHGNSSASGHSCHPRGVGTRAGHRDRLAHLSGAAETAGWTGRQEEGVPVSRSTQEGGIEGHIERALKGLQDRPAPVVLKH